MDELQMVRELFAEPAPPRPEVTAAARARLTGSDARSRAGRYGRPRGWRHFPVTVAAPVGAAAAVTAVAIVLASLPHAPSAPGGGVTSGPAQAGQLESGRYWVQPGVVGNYLRVASAGDRYVVLEKVAVQQWTPQSKLASPSIEQPLSVQPASPADEAAWRAAGSPTVWTDVGQDVSIASPQGFTNGFSFPLKAGRGKPAASEVGYGSAGFYVFGKQLSARQLLALTANPATLKRFLYQQYKSGGWRGGFGSYLVSALPPLLTLPVTTQVRSALLHVLTSLPGTRNLGRTRGVVGLPGIGVAVDEKWSSCGNDISLESGSGLRPTFSSCGVQQILIVNPVTWLPIAEELRYTSLPPGQSWSAPAGMFSYELFGAGYWTNANPPVR
jgi:hypothetical protein